MSSKHFGILLVVFASIGLSFGVNYFSEKRIAPDSREPNRIPEAVVWRYILQEAGRHDLHPQFVYALAWAESSLNANAENGQARGIMQVTGPTWQDISELPFEMAWDYQTNIDVALDYLVFCKQLLVENERFSLPLLAASYRYGPYKVKRKKYKIDSLEVPENEIYRSIFAGETFPVEPPL